MSFPSYTAEKKDEPLVYSVLSFIYGKEQGRTNSIRCPLLHIWQRTRTNHWFTVSFPSYTAENKDEPLVYVTKTTSSIEDIQEANFFLFLVIPMLPQEAISFRSPGRVGGLPVTAPHTGPTALYPGRGRHMSSSLCLITLLP